MTDYISTDILDTPETLISYLKDAGFEELRRYSNTRFDTGLICANRRKPAFRVGDFKSYSEKWISIGDGNNRIVFIRTYGGTLYNGIRFRYEIYDVRMVGNATVSSINKIEFVDADRCVEIIQELAKS